MPSIGSSAELFDMTPSEIAQLMRECAEELDRRSTEELQQARNALLDRLEVARAEATLIDAALELLKRASDPSAEQSP